VPPPELSLEQREQLLQRNRRARPRLRQTMLPLEVVSKGRFEKSEPTVYRGEDLDVPTFVRRGVVLN
jgi:cell division protein FtsZ